MIVATFAAMTTPVDWSAPVTPDEMFRRAGGRARYNSLRQDLAMIRRIQVLRLIRKFGWVWGVQKRIADELHVSEATISRDVKWALCEGRTRTATLLPSAQRGACGPSSTSPAGAQDQDQDRM